MKKLLKRFAIALTISILSGVGGIVLLTAPLILLRRFGIRIDEGLIVTAGLLGYIVFSLVMFVVGWEIAEKLEQR